jgi:hypothetical protein
MTLLLLSSTVSNKSSIRQTRLASLDAVVLENGSLRLTVVPELGGKIVSLIRSESGFEYLLQPDNSERAYRRRNYGDRFEDYEPSGFDECLPTIAECLYPDEPFFPRRLPDHGDIWCLPTGIEIVGEQIKLTNCIRSLPLHFKKTIQLRGHIVRLEYEVTNLSQSVVRFLWSAHPLLRVEPGAEIILPRNIREVEIGWSRDGRLGKSGDRCSWPRAADCSGAMVELNRIGSPNAGTAEMLFTHRLL